MVKWGTGLISIKILMDKYRTGLAQIWRILEDRTSWKVGVSIINWPGCIFSVVVATRGRNSCVLSVSCVEVDRCWKGFCQFLALFQCSGPLTWCICVNENSTRLYHVTDWLRKNSWIYAELYCTTVTNERTWILMSEGTYRKEFQTLLNSRQVGNGPLD